MLFCKTSEELKKEEWWTIIGIYSPQEQEHTRWVESHLLPSRATLPQSPVIGPWPRATAGHTVICYIHGQNKYMYIKIKVTIRTYFKVRVLYFTRTLKYALYFTFHVCF